MDTRRVRAISLITRAESVATDTLASGSSSMSFVEGVVNSVIETAAAATENTNAVVAIDGNIETKVKHSKDVDDPLGGETQQTKKLKTGTEDDKKLEQRLGGILCCAVCLDLPKSSVYQVGNVWS